MSGIADWILHLDPLWIYVVCGLIVFLEDAIFVGFAIPGETAAVVAGVASAVDGADLRISLVVIVAAAILGDSVGYELGRSFVGPKVLTSRVFARHRDRLAKTEDLIRRRGGLAVFLGRWTAFFRAMMPALAGASRMRYRTFLLWNACGGLAWGTTYVLVGHAAGSSYQAIEHQVGRWAAVVVGVIVVAGLVLWHVRRRHTTSAGD